MRQCMKPNCFNSSIPRGKYCELHRTNRRIIEERNRIEERTRIEERNIEERQRNMERQQIIEEQEREYNETMMKDIERIEEEKRKRIEEKEKKNLKEIEMDSLRQQIFSIEMNDKSFMIRFVLNHNHNHNHKISHFFKNDATFKDVFDYIDLYIYDNNIKLENYYLVCYPNLEYTRQNAKDKLENHFNYKKINLFIKPEEE